MKGTGSLNAETCYKVVYFVVERELMNSAPPRGCEQHWEWARRIPRPEDCTIEIASALCSSVSHSRQIGLECFLQSKISLSEIRHICGKAFGVRERVNYERLYANTNDYSTRLGEFIRDFYNGLLVLNEENHSLLSKL